MTMAANPLAADLNHVFDHALDPWEDQRGDPVLLAGGTGFHGYGPLACEVRSRACPAKPCSGFAPAATEMSTSRRGVG
jgi:hypothetical protein